MMIAVWARHMWAVDEVGPFWRYGIYPTQRGTSRAGMFYVGSAFYEAAS